MSNNKKKGKKGLTNTAKNNNLKSVKANKSIKNKVDDDDNDN